MRMHRLGRLFSLDRYRQCRELFEHPARAHLALTGVTQGPFTLEFKRGGALEFPKFRKVRSLWTYLFADPAQFKREVDEYVRAARTLTPLEGFDASYLASGVEAANAQAFSRDGIPVGPEHQEKLATVAAEFGVKPPW